MWSISNQVHFYFLKIIWLLMGTYLLTSFGKILSEYRVSWFRPAECVWKNSQSWRDVALVIKNDPLGIQEGFLRGKHPWNLIEDILRLSVASCFLLLISFYIFATDPKSLISSDFGFLFIKNVTPGSSFSAGSGLVTLIAGLMALGGALYTAISQLRARVRSENRQKWINDVREAIAILIEDIPVINDILPRPNLRLIPREAGLARAKLELLLNPSERDHRTLSAFVRVAYRFDQIPLDTEVWEQLARLGIDRKKIDPWTDNIELKDRRTKRVELISMIIRLSNALLKREWELVKFGR